MARSDLIGLIGGYEKKNGKRQRSFYSKRISGTVTLNMKRFLDSRPLKLMRSLTDLFSYATAKTYGIFLLSFGLISLIIQFVKDYFGVFGGLSLSALIIGAAFAALSIPLLLVDVPISVMLQRFKPTEIIFFEFFCIKKLYYTGGERALHPLFAALFGALLAALGIFIPLWWIALGLGILLFVGLTFLSPEFAFFFSLLALPFMPLIPGYTAIMAVAALLGALSFIRKAIFGKRVIFIEQYDLLIGVMCFAVLASGIFRGGLDSFVGGILTVAMALGYFLSANVVTNRRLGDCAVNAVVISSIPTSIVSIVTFVTTLHRGDGGYFLREGISATFDTKGAAAAFFLVAAIFSLTIAKESHRGIRALYSVIFILNLMSLFLTGMLFAFLALLIGYLAYVALKSGGWLALYLPILFLLPYLIFFFPESALSSLPDATYADGSAEVFRASLLAFKDNIVMGVGIGIDSFTATMAKYGIESFESSGNLFLELGLEAGIFALLAFLMLLVVRLGHRAAYQRYVKNSQLSKLSPMMSVTVFALLVFGSLEHIFRDPSIMYLFWCVFGIAGASLRVCKREYDDRTLYFEDTKSSNSSVISVYIK